VVAVQAQSVKMQQPIQVNPVVLVYQTQYQEQLHITVVVAVVEAMGFQVQRAG
jgi:hypothetical protein